MKCWSPNLLLLDVLHSHLVDFAVVADVNLGKQGGQLQKKKGRNQGGFSGLLMKSQRRMIFKTGQKITLQDYVCPRFPRKCDIGFLRSGFSDFLIL